MWVAVQSQTAPHDCTSMRTQEDGILLVVTVRVHGKEARALIDSGASRSFISPAAIVRLGLHCVPSECVLELADGKKVLSQGKPSHTPICIGSSVSKLDLTVTPLLQQIDIILGVNWLVSGAS